MYTALIPIQVQEFTMCLLNDTQRVEQAMKFHFSISRVSVNMQLYCIYVPIKAFK